MINAMIHRFEGTLTEAIQHAFNEDGWTEEPAKYPSFVSLLTEKTNQFIGAIQGHMPALVGEDQKKPYIRALRGLAGF